MASSGPQDDSIRNPHYSQFVAFRNSPGLCESILQSVAPGWQQQLCVTDQVRFLLARVDWDGDIMRLFAITYQLRTLTVDSAFVTSEVLRQTGLASHCAKLLSIWTESSEVYFLQLEAFWILTNLARGDESDVKLLLSDELPEYSIA
jgi:hypothetical protein